MKFKSELFPFIQRFRPHLPRMFLGTLSGSIALVAAVGLLSLSGWFLSAAAFAGLTTAAAQAFNFFYPSVGVRLFAATRIIARYGERLIAHDTTFRILKTLRIWFYQSIEPLAPACLSKYRSGDILNRLVSDIDALDNLYIRIFSPAGSAIVIVIFISIFLGLLDITLSTAVCGILIIAIVVVPWVASFISMGTGRCLAHIGGIFRTCMIEGIQGLTDLIVFGAMEKQLDRLDAIHRQIISLQRRMSHIRGLSNAFICLLSGCAVWVALFIGVSLVGSGKMPGEFLACVALAVWASFEAATPLAHAFQHLGRTREAARRITEITSVSPATVFPEAYSDKLKTSDIDIENVCFRYDSDAHPVINDLTLMIAQGCKVALVGETGCGKSTLVKLLTRAWDPMTGTIRIGGQNLRDLGEYELRRTITVISQQAHLFNATLEDNLRIARPDASEPDLFHALEKVHLADFVRSLPKGIKTWVGESGKRLSGGQARRLALARAVLHNAPVWVLDEPTEGIDKITEKEVLQSLIGFAANRTVLIITHRLVNFALIDKIAFMDQGRIVACGSHRELFHKNARYRTLVSKMA